MAKTAAISIRVTDELKAALEAAAHDDERSMASYAQRVLAEHLREKGYLK